MNIRTLLPVMLMACLPCGAFGADFDGSKTLVCAPAEATDMPVGGNAVVRLRPADLGLPAFLRLDFARKLIVGPEHSAPIRFIEQGKDQILLQGTELGIAWTLVLNKEDGTLVGTYADRYGAVSVAGACTPG